MSCGFKAPACAGQLRHSVVIERRVDVEDSLGGSSTTWEQRHKTLAKLEWRNGNEAARHGRTEAFRGWKVTLRFLSGIVESDRLVIDGLPWNIKSIEDVDRRGRWLIIRAEEGVAD